MTPAESFSRAAGAFSRAQTLALVGMPRPYRQSSRARVRAFYRSRGQLLVCDAPPDSSIDQATQSIKGMPAHIAIIEPKSKLVDVPAQVLAAGVVIDPMQAALKDCPYTPQHRWWSRQREHTHRPRD